jgi:hypothetical protein
MPRQIRAMKGCRYNELKIEAAAVLGTMRGGNAKVSENTSDPHAIVNLKRATINCQVDSCMPC